MKRIAVIKLGTLEIKLDIVEVLDNQTFMVIDQYRESTRIIDDFENDIPISTSRLTEILNTLNHFNAICVSKKINEVYSFADIVYKNIKNEHSFFEQINSKTGYRFVLLSDKDYIDYIYSAVVSSMNTTKGIIVHVDEYKSYIIQYNRRMILNQLTIPAGYATYIHKLNECDSESRYLFVEKIVKESLNSFEGEWLKNMPQDTTTILQGDSLKNISKIIRKQTRYPFDRDQNFVTNKQNLLSTCGTLAEMPFDDKKKVKGTMMRADAMIITANIVKAIVNNLTFMENNDTPHEEEKKNILLEDINAESEDIEVEQEEVVLSSLIFCEFDLTHGLLFKMLNENSSTSYRPTDVLDFSLSAIIRYYNGSENSEYICKLSCMIFKQLKVLHKLNRYYLTVLKIASKLYDTGARIDPSDIDKYGYIALINSPIFGVQHREILLAGFVLMCQNNENFMLTEWAKYKPVILKDGEDELELRLACQRLAIILKLARAFDKYSNSRITDISCDNLGECVIMKTTMSNPSILEIREAKKLDNEFRKVFNNKKIEIL